MKTFKYLIPFFLFLFIAATVTVQYLGSPTTIVETRGIHQVDSAFVMPSDTLVSAPNGSSAIKNGSLYTKFSGKWVYVPSVYPYDIRKWGAIYDSTIDNTAAIQRAIDSAFYRGGGRVYIPSGVWGITKLHLRPNVKVDGESDFASVLKARIADTMMVYDTSVIAYYRGWQQGTAGFSNLFLEGHNTAVTGISLQYYYWFSVNNIRIDSCTSVGINMKGTLTGKFDNLQVQYCPTGILADSANVVGGAGFITPNLLEFDNCRVYWSTKWGFFLRASQGQVVIRNCDLSDNGTLHNPNTGAIYTVGDNGPINGLRIQNTWFEANKGTVVYFDLPTLSAITYQLDNDVFLNSSASYGLYLPHSASAYNVHVDLNSTKITTDSLDIYCAGNASYYGSFIISMRGSSYGTTNLTGVQIPMTFKNLDVDGYSAHPISNTSTPFISATKNGAGSGATASIDAGGTDADFTLTVNTGTSPVANDTLVIVGYSVAWVGTNINPIMSPANQAAASLVGGTGGTASQVWCNGGGTFHYPYIFTNSVALAASTTYKWHLWVPGK